MNALHTSLVRTEHAYTQSKTPWRLDADRAQVAASLSGMKDGWKLFHYLSGGGIRMLGRTVEQEERLQRQKCFLAVSAVLAAVWVFFYIF